MYHYHHYNMYCTIAIIYRSVYSDKSDNKYIQYYICITTTTTVCILYILYHSNYLAVSYGDNTDTVYVHTVPLPPLQIVLNYLYTIATF